MRFFIGLHQPSDAQHFDAAFVSVNRLRNRKGEPFIIAKTGMSVRQHQQLTVERYLALRACDTGGVYVMPVLQGFEPADYVVRWRELNHDRSK